MSVSLLEVEELSVSFRYRAQIVSPVERVSFSVRQGESIGVVGESGSGKSTLALALLRLTPPARELNIGGRISFGGRDVLGMSPRELTEYRGGGVALIPQDPMTSLNPTLTVGQQLGETLRLGDRQRIRERSVEALAAVRIADPEARLDAYPHQLSGGMRQRVVGAIGIARSPRLLIADEPTTALDVTVQREYLDLLDVLRRERGMAMLFISHDLGVVAHVCERIMVMYAGQIVEDGPVRDVLDRPRHWYTAALVAVARAVGDGARRLPAVAGQPPSLMGRPPGCRFSPRCPNAKPACAEPPALETLADGRRLRCFFPREGA